MIYLICSCGSGLAIRVNDKASASHSDYSLFTYRFKGSLSILKEFKAEHPDAVEVTEDEYDETFSWGKDIFD